MHLSPRSSVALAALTLLVPAPALCAQAPVGPLAALPPAEQHHDGGPTPILDVALSDDVPGPGDGAAKDSGSPHFLGFVAGAHYPPADERIDPKLLSEVRLEPADGRPAPTSFGFVMFSKRITEQRLEILKALGCRVLGRHPHYTVKVAFPPEQLDQLAELDFVRWIGSPRVWQKVHPSLVRRCDAALDGGLVDMYVSVYESDLSPLATSVLGPAPSVVDAGEAPRAGDESYSARSQRSNGWQQRALEALGLEVGVYDDAQRTFKVRGAPAALPLLSALDFVLFVEEVPLAQPLHDDTSAMIMADSARYYANGNTNFPVPVGLLDTGLSLTHWDLAFHVNAVGWDFSGSTTGAWDDPCGHGTHVTGTFAGDGTVSPEHRGMAPGIGSNGQFARLYNAKILMGCGTQSVDFAGAMSVMRAPYQTSARPMIVNNSWGSSPNGAAWVGSEYEARILDDEVFWQNQLYVFAAGNDGPATGSVGLQAGAKNAFTVGSVNDYRTGSSYPGELSSFSSRGVMGDSRWKPNVVAPGDWVRSLLAGSTSSYTNKAGTSMAAPHVTGVAAQMCDHHAFFRNAPARIAANLMATAIPKNNTVITTHSNGHLDTYGAGRIQAYHASLNSLDSGWTNWGFTLNAGQGTYGDVYVSPGCTRLVVVMNWHEQAASAGASQAALNDWDLWIDREPFTGGTNTGEYNAGQSSRNNTEIRYIENPPVGWYRWKAHPYNATSTGRFGVSAFAIYGDTTPTVGLSVAVSSNYVRQGDVVTFTPTVYNPSWVASAAHVRMTASGGAWFVNSWRYLNDGPLDDLSDNSNFAGECQLGDILNGNSRSASFQYAWYSDGWKQIDTSVFSDNANVTPVSNFVYVDSTPPSDPTNVVSSTHPVGAWSCNNLVALQWDASFDSGVGLAGYSYVFDQTYDTEPDGQVESSLNSEVFYAPDSLATYYFHVRAVDTLGNVSATAHAGPFSVMSAGGWALCTPKLNSQFCLPTMSMSGRISASGQDDLHLYASSIINNKAGLLFWGFSETSVPFQGGLKCVGGATYRSPVLNSGGTSGGADCSGSFDFAFTQAYAASFGWTAPGSVIFTQYWYRDPAASFATGLTDATAVVMCE